MIKLFAFDLDGTLLKEDQSIDAETLSAIHKFKEHGIRFVIATGRNYDIVEGVLTAHNLDCDILLNNGHEFISKDRKTHTKHIIDKDKLEEVYKILSDHKFKTVLHADDGKKYIFIDKEEYFQEHLYGFGKLRNVDTDALSHTPLFNRETFLSNAVRINSLEDLGDVGVMKTDNSNTDAELCKKAVELLKKVEGIELNTSYDANVEVCDNKINKGMAVLKIAEMYGINADEIAVFGDGDNDIGLINCTKHSFAMGNAREVLKKHAAHITDTNENQGVLKGIRKILAQENGLSF